jgi:pyruvate formate lyase activating enzyme
MINFKVEIKGANMPRYIFGAREKEAQCKICGNTSVFISEFLGVCSRCAKTHPGQAKVFIKKAHKKSKEEFGLPAEPPRVSPGARCNFCVNQCSIASEEKGFCGLRTNIGGKLHHISGTADKAIISWYCDPLPTNCVADWVCPAGTETGYPKYSYSPGIEYGYKNLAVFLGACTFDCLFCQNWHYREMTRALSPTATAEALADAVDERTSCICFFGGDPTAQLPYCLNASRLAIEKNRDRILRICWESNGSMNPKLMRKMAQLSLESGGCIKFDLKAFDENLHYALTGVSDKQTLENFAELAQLIKERPEPPFLVASTLMVPGYIEAEEISRIATFIADLDPAIPYSLLAFYPCFHMMDFPTTSRAQAEECQKAALEAGLKRVKIGNIHLLS